MAKFKSRRRTTRSLAASRRGRDVQTLHLKVNSPRIMMFQSMRLLGKMLKLCFILVVIGLIGWGAYLGVHHFFIENEKYRLNHIVLDTNGHLDERRIAEVGEIDLNATIFAIDIAKVRNRLIALPEVIDCKIERRWPGTLRVHITERVPVVWIACQASNLPGRKADGGLLADKAGITFSCEGNLWETAKDLPVITVKDAKPNVFKQGEKMTHPEAMRALHLLKMFTTYEVREEWQPERITVLNGYSMEAVSRDGTCATFGMYDHERQMKDLMAAREHAYETNRKIRRINLLLKKNIPVLFQDGVQVVRPKRDSTAVTP